MAFLGLRRELQALMAATQACVANQGIGIYDSSMQPRSLCEHRLDMAGGNDWSAMIIDIACENSR